MPTRVRGVGRGGLIALTLAACVAAPGLAGDADRTLQSAHGLLQRGVHDLALAEYEAYLAADPDDKANALVAQYGRAVCLVRLGRDGEALGPLRDLAGADGFAFAPDVLLLLAHVEMRGGEAGRAAGHLETLIEQHPRHGSVGQARALLVEALHRDGRHGEVGPVARAALNGARGESASRVRLYWGLSESARGRHDRAATLFERAIEDAQGRGPIADHARLGLAQSLHEQGRGGDAKPLYEATLGAQDAGVADRARYGLARLAFDEGDLSGAAKLLDVVIDREGDTGVRYAAVLLRARVSIDDGDGRIGRQLLGLLGEHETLADDAAYWEAKSRLREGEAGRAGEGFAEALERFPKSELAPDMAYDLAVALSRAGEARDAEAAFGRFIDAHEKHPNRDAALLTRASLLHELGEYEDSRGVLGELGRAGDASMRASGAFLDAENLYLLGNARQAESAYRAFIEQNPGDERVPTAWYRIGSSLYERGEFDESEQLLLDAAGAGAGGDHQALLLAGDIALRKGAWADAGARLGAYLEHAEAGERDGALLKLGLAQARQGDHAGALATLARISPEAGASTRERAAFERGQALIALERWDEASAALEQFLGEWDESELVGAARRHLGSISQRRGDLEAAASWFGSAARDAGDLGASALYDRGRAELALGKYDDAAQTMGELLDRRPGGDLRARASCVRAIALSRSGKHRAALDVMGQFDGRSLGGLGPELASAMAYEKGRALSETGDAKGAMKAYDTLARDAEAPAGLRAHARVALASLQMGEGRHGDAAVLLDGVLEALPGLDERTRAALSEQAAYQRALCAREAGDHARVAELLGGFDERWPESDVGDSAALVGAEALIALGRQRDAIALLTPLGERGVDEAIAAPALLRLGEAHATLQRWARSEEAFTLFLDRFGADHDLWFQAQFGVGWARENQGRRGEAMGSYRAVVDRHNGPTAARAQFQIGECLYADKRYEDAIRELLRVDILYAYPEWSAAALYEAGRCFEERGRLGEARTQFSAVVDRFGDSEWATLASDRLAAIARAMPPGRSTGDGATQ